MDTQTSPDLQPAARTFDLKEPANVYDLATGAQFDLQAEGPLQTAFTTTVGGVEYVVTQAAAGVAAAGGRLEGLKADELAAAAASEAPAEPARAPEAPAEPAPAPEAPAEPAPAPEAPAEPAPAPEAPAEPAPAPDPTAEAAAFLARLLPELEQELAAEAQRILALLEGK